MYDISDYARTYDTMEIAETSAATGILAGMGVGAWLVSMAVCVIAIVSMWKIFTKAGKPGWAAIVPVYNAVVLFQIAGVNPWLLLLAIIPFVNFVALPVLMIMVYVKLAKAFGKGAGFAVGMLFLNVIFMPILAFSDAEYQGV